MKAGWTCLEAVDDDKDSVAACVKATAALRGCMAANEPMFKHYIRAMDRGLEDNERRGYGIEYAEDDGGAGRTSRYGGAICGGSRAWIRWSLTYVSCYS